MVNIESGIPELHQATIQAHLNRDVGFLVQDLADGFSSVSGGEIQKPTKEEVESSFADYLSNTTLTEYRDLQEPIVGVSRDGSIAWSTVQMKVADWRAIEDGSER